MKTSFMNLFVLGAMVPAVCSEVNGAVEEPAVPPPDISSVHGTAVQLPYYSIDSFGPRTFFVPGQQNGYITGGQVAFDSADRSLGFQGQLGRSGELRQIPFRFSNSLVARANADADLSRVLSGKVDPTWQIGAACHFIEKLPIDEKMDWLKMINLLGLYSRESFEHGIESPPGVSGVDEKHADRVKFELQFGGIIQSDSALLKTLSWLPKDIAGNFAASIALGFEHGSNFRGLKEVESNGKKVRVGILGNREYYPGTVTLAYAGAKETILTKTAAALLGAIPGVSISEATKYVPVYGAFYTRDLQSRYLGGESYGFTFGFRSIEGGRYSFPVRLTLMRKYNGDGQRADTTVGVSIVTGFFD